ncbi:putative CENP-V/GFA domain, Mss4-like superfamily protein [Septoria linicola]|nr:putative CENP-V/GFA domain, Mss4-like superfamily protein [Septoria linicola]
MPNEPTGDPNSHDVSKFSEKLVGTCLCGSVTVTINDNELFSKKRGHLCHCANCRKVAGSYVASNLLIEQEKVSIEDKDGTLKTYEDRETLSGNPVYRTFCSTDGNPIKSETEAYPGKVVLKMGIYPRIPQPEAEAFGVHKHDWQGIHQGVDTYEIKWAGPEKKLLNKGAPEDDEMISKGVQ